MSNKETVVKLGERDFVVRPIPLRRFEEAEGVIPDLIAKLREADDKNGKDQDAAFRALFQAIIAAPAQLLGVFLDDVDAEVVKDASIPDIVGAFGEIAKVNRLDVLKKGGNILSLLSASVSSPSS